MNSRRTKRIAALVFAVLLASLFVAYWLGTLYQEAPAHQQVLARNRVGEQSTMTDGTNSTTTLLNPPQPSTAEKLLNQTRARLTRPAQAAASAQAMNVPVQFWGKILDQDDVPLSGVKVRANVRHWRGNLLGSVETDFIRQEATSNSDGRFEISGATGDVLAIEALEKEGYEPEPIALRWFGYNISTNISPDLNNPVVLRMWQKDVASELITGNKHFRIVPDGRAYTVDLVQGKITESATVPGDFRIWISRPQDVAEFGQKYDWSCAIEPIGGGVLEEDDVYSSMYLAPSDGYLASFYRTIQTSSKRWSPGFRTRLYLRTRGGAVYSRLKLDTSSFYSPEDHNGRIWIQYALNTNGSRILR